jgi:mono/diheme cytochrome c family protein
VAIALLAAPAVSAEEKKAAPSAEKGHALAQRLCQGCHLIEEKAGATVPEGVPTFRGIANRPGQTAQRITNVLIQPHAPMPDIRLTSAEILDIIAYLDTLRTNKAGPPLLPPPGSPKPKYPEPS